MKFVESVKPKTSQIVDLTDYGYPNYGISKDKQIYNFTSNTFLNSNKKRVAVRVNNKYKHINVNKTYAKCFGTEIDNIPDSDKRDLTDMGYPGYILLKDKRIWSQASLQYINTSRKLSVYVNNEQKHLSINKLYRNLFETTISDIPKQNKRDLSVIGYPGYWITRDGEIWNDNEKQWFKNTSNRITFTINGVKYYTTVSGVLSKVFRTPLDKIKEYDKRNLDFIGFPNYTITKDGRVWSHNRLKWLQPISSNDGYLVIKLMDNYKEKKISIHRLVALAFIDNPDNKTEVNHIKVIDGVCDKTNNHVDNLEWVTHQENIDHATINELGSSVITSYQAHEICLLLEEGMTSVEIAKQLGINTNIVKKIKCRNTWKHISKDYIFPLTRAQLIKIDLTPNDTWKRLCRNGTAILNGPNSDTYIESTWYSTDPNYTLKNLDDMDDMLAQIEDDITKTYY